MLCLYCVICTRVGTCDYVYVGVHACIYIMYVGACSYIYVCVWIAPLGLEGAELPLLQGGTLAPSISGGGRDDLYVYV